MTLFAFSIAEKFASKHRDAARWLNDWRVVVMAAAWESLADVRRQFSHADGVKLKSKVVVTVFNVKGNEYRLLTAIDYDVQIVQVLDVLTHAEYSRQLWKDRF